MMKGLHLIQFLLIISLGTLGVGQSTQAAIIYSNGIGVSSSAQSDLDTSISADDFVLTAPDTTIRSIHWRGKEVGTRSIEDVFTIKIYNDSSGPNNVLANIAVNTFNRISTGTANVYDYSTNIPNSTNSITLIAGNTYWLSIYNDTTSDSSYNWEWVHGVGHRNTFRSFDAGSSWAGPENLRMSFELDDQSVQVVPVPAAVWLMGSAILGLVGFRRKKSA